MESSCSLHSPTVTTISSSLSRPGFNVKPSGYAQFLRFSSSKRYSHARKLKFLDLRAQASGTAKIRSEAVEAVPKKENSKDEDLAFVAGATGRVGSRTVRELLKLGFRVRAGVRSAQRAQSLLESVKQMKLENASDGTQPVEKLEIVECDLEKQDRIVPALGNASVVICCIGASEKEVADFTGPYRIDYQATKNLVDAATVAKVNHFVLVTSLGTNKVGFPAVFLNLFWGVLIWKRKAEEALIASGLPYTIVRPGGMERPTDAYKETHNITLSEEDTLFGGQVSNLQIAELIACMAKNPGLSYCKVVEAIAETTAPLTPMEELLAKIPSQRANIYSPKESTGADEPDPATSKSVISVEPSTTVDKKPVQSEAAAAPQLSPYTTYEDLKPLTSPTPTPSTTAAATETTLAPEEQGKTRPLSPYAAYEDLKPPSSPSPTASGHSSASAPVENASSLSGNDVATIVSSVVGKDGSSATIDTKPAQADGTAAKPLSPYTVFEDLKPPTSPIPTPSTKANPTETTLPQEDQRRPRPLSPYAVYDDLKPPSSPSPTAPSALLQSATTSNSTVPPPLADKPSNEQHAPSKPRPLSPYAMYEDLKPPTSPVPVPSKS